MIFFLILMFLVLVAQIAELFVPPLDSMYNAHIYITPVLVVYRGDGAAVAAPPYPRLFGRLPPRARSPTGDRRAC